MKLLLVVHSSNVGGTEVCFGRVLRALEASGHEVVGAYPDGRHAGEWEKVARRVRYTGSLPPGPRMRGYLGWIARRWPASRGIARVMRDERPDAVVVFSSVITAPVSLASAHGIPCVCYVREFVAPPWVQKRLWRFLGRRCAALVAVSSSLAGQLEKSSRAPVTLVHDGIPLPDLTEAPAWPPAEPVIACYAGYDPAKGGEVFVRAAARMALGSPTAVFRLYGVPQPVHMAERDRLVALANGLGLGDRLAFVSEADFQSTYRSASIVVVPSHREGLGLVALEAMAWGVPVVASKTGGLLDVVDDDVTGVLVPVADDRAIALACGELLRDTSKLQRMGDAARRRVEDSFGVEQSVRSLEELLSHVATGIARRGSRRGGGGRRAR